LKILASHSVYPENVSVRYVKRLSGQFDVPIRLEDWHNTFDNFFNKNIDYGKERKEIDKKGT